MELTEALRARRMVRSFTGRPVPPHLLDRVLDSARRAPTAGNTEGWALVVLAGEAETAPFWAATTTEAWRRTARRWPGLSAAPVVVVVLASPERYRQRYGEPDKAASGLDRDDWPVPYWYFDAGQVVLTMLLTATDAGLGGCFLGNFRGEEALGRTLGIPAGWRYAGAVLLGEAAGDDPPSASVSRPWRTAGATIHRGRW
jgi:nitroreductase